MIRKRIHDAHIFIKSSYRISKETHLLSQLFRMILVYLVIILPCYCVEDSVVGLLDWSIQRAPGVPLHGRHQHTVLGLPATADPPRASQVASQVDRQGTGHERSLLREPPQISLARRPVGQSQQAYTMKDRNFENYKTEMLSMSKTEQKKID